MPNMCLLYQMKKIGNKIRCFVWGIWRHAPSYCCWVILAGGHFLKTVGAASWKMNPTKRTFTMFLLLSSVSSDPTPRRMLLFMRVWKILLHSLGLVVPLQLLIQNYLHILKWGGWKGSAEVPLDTFSTRHFYRFRHSSGRLWRPEWPCASNKKTKKYWTGACFCRALCWQLDLLLDCQSSFLDNLEEKQIVDPSSLQTVCSQSQGL